MVQDEEETFTAEWREKVKAMSHARHAKEVAEEASMAAYSGAAAAPWHPGAGHDWAVPRSTQRVPYMHD